MLHDGFALIDLCDGAVGFCYFGCGVGYSLVDSGIVVLDGWFG